MAIKSIPMSEFSTDNSKRATGSHGYKGKKKHEKVCPPNCYLVNISQVKVGVPDQGGVPILTINGKPVAKKVPGLAKGQVAWVLA